MVPYLKFITTLIKIVLIGMVVVSYATGKPGPGKVRHDRQDTIQLRIVPGIEAPVIAKSKINFIIDFVFDYCPEEYYVYYNKLTDRLIIEFFGKHITAAPLSIKGTSVVKDLSISNNETTWSLNGKSSQIHMAIEKGWHYDSKVINGKTLRLKLWMPLNPSDNLQKRRSHALPMMLTSLVVAGATFALIFILVDHSKQ